MSVKFTNQGGSDRDGNGGLGLRGNQHIGLPAARSASPMASCSTTSPRLATRTTAPSNLSARMSAAMAVGSRESRSASKPSAVALAFKVCLLGLDRECPKAEPMIRAATSRCNRLGARLSESRNGMWVGSRRVLSGCAGEAVPVYALHTHNTACGGLQVILKERRCRTMASLCAGSNTPPFAQGSADAHPVSADSRAVKKRV